MSVRTRRGFLTADALDAGYIEQRGWLSPSKRVANVVELHQVPQSGPVEYRVIHTTIVQGKEPAIISDKVYSSLTSARQQLAETGTR